MSLQPSSTKPSSRGGIHLPPTSITGGSLHEAIEKGDDARGIRLIEHGASLEQKLDGHSPLSVAISHGRHQLVEALLAAGADTEAPASRNGEDWPPVLLACWNGQMRIASALIDAKADVDRPLRNFNGLLGEYPPIFTMSYKGSLEAVVLLLKAGADPDKQRRDGATSAYIAVVRDDVDILIELLYAGADARLAPTLCIAELGGCTPGCTPLERAAQKGHMRCTALIKLATLDATPLSADELGALSADVRLAEVGLTCAFGEAPLATVERAIAIARALQDEGARRGSETLVGDGLRVQLVALALLGSLEPKECHRLLLTRRALQVFAVAIEQSCKLLLAHGPVQRALDERWRVGRPSLARPSSAIPPSSSVPSFRYPEWWAALAFDAARFVVQLLQIALYPPFEAELERQSDARAAAAHRDVLERNPDPTSAAEETAQTGKPPAKPAEFLLDGVCVASCWELDEAERYSLCRARFHALRAARADDAARAVQAGYLVLQPQPKFWLATALMILLAVLLTTLDARAGPLPLSLLLVWCLQRTLAEVSELVHNLPLWCADKINGLELAATASASVGLALRLLLWSVVDAAAEPTAIEGHEVATTFGAVPEDATPRRLFAAQVHGHTAAAAALLVRGSSSEQASVTAAALLGAAVASLWISQTCRLLQQSPRLGPLVLMAELMIYDTANWLVLAAGPTLGFASGMAVLFNGASLDEGGDCAALQGADGVGVVLVRLFEMMLGSDNALVCLRESQQPITAVLLMDAFLVLLVLLGTNMLIAIMAKTFDAIYEQQASNFMFLKALHVVSWSDTPAVPSPLALLGVPWRLLELLRRLWVAGGRRLNALPFHRHADDGDGQKVCSDEEGESAWACSSWRPSVPGLKLLREKVEEDLSNQAGVVAPDDHWRTSLARKTHAVALQVAAIDEKVDGLRHSTESKVQALEGSLGEIKALLHEMCGAHHHETSVVAHVVRGS